MTDRRTGKRAQKRAMRRSFYRVFPERVRYGVGGFGSVCDRIYAAVCGKRIFVCVRRAPSSTAQTYSLYFETEQRLETVGVQPAENRANALAPVRNRQTVRRRIAGNAVSGQGLFPVASRHSAQA